MNNWSAVASLTFASLLCGVIAQSEEQEKRYSKFTEAIEPQGYDWEPYDVKTDDGWHLTLFRITGKNGERPALEKENKDKPPVMLQHGAGESASQWAGATLTGLPSMPL